MTRETIKEDFLELKPIKDDIESDFLVFDYAYEELGEDDYFYRMKNALSSYEEIPNLNIYDRVEYNEGKIIFQEAYNSKKCKNEEDSLLLTIETLDRETDGCNPYTYLGAVQAFRMVKKYNKMNGNKCLKKRLYK